MTRGELLDSVWGEDDVGDEALTVIVSRLRRHFRLLGVDETVIETIPKTGYRIVGMGSIPARFAERLSGAANAVRLAWLALSVAAVSLAVALASLLRSGS